MCFQFWVSRSKAMLALAEIASTCPYCPAAIMAESKAMLALAEIAS